MIKVVLRSFAVLALCASICAASVPDAGNCSVDPSDALLGMVLSPIVPGPSPASINTISVRNSANVPMNSCAVVVEVGPSTEVCGSTVLAGVTNASGQVVLTLGGGGCAHHIPLSGIVRAQGVTIRTYENVKSPDYDGASGNLVVNLPDLTQFSGEFGGGIPPECHDYDNSGSTGLPDLIIFGSPFQLAASCTP